MIVDNVIAGDGAGEGAGVVGEFVVDGAAAGVGDAAVSCCLLLLPRLLQSGLVTADRYVETRQRLAAGSDFHMSVHAM